MNKAFKMAMLRGNNNSVNGMNGNRNNMNLSRNAYEPENYYRGMSDGRNENRMNRWGRGTGRGMNRNNMDVRNDRYARSRRRDYADYGDYNDYDDYDDYDDDEDEENSYRYNIRGKMRIPSRKDAWGEQNTEHKLDQRTAERWANMMQNVDGTTGPHWSYQQVEQLKQQKRELQPYSTPDLYATLNMMYSDYKDVAKKFNADNQDFYICMAKAWLDDKDAGSGESKTMNYFKYVVD